MLINGKFSLEQIARMDDLQLYHIVFRPRENGELIRRDPSLPGHVRTNARGDRVLGGDPVDFKAMFKQVNRTLPAEVVEEKYRTWQMEQRAVGRMVKDLGDQMATMQHVRKLLTKKLIPWAEVAKYNQ